MPKIKLNLTATLIAFVVSLQISGTPLHAASASVSVEVGATEVYDLEDSKENGSRALYQADPNQGNNSMFSVDAYTGVISFLSPATWQENGNNSYIVSVTAGNGNSATDYEVAIEVNEPPLSVITIEDIIIANPQLGAYVSIPIRLSSGDEDVGGVSFSLSFDHDVFEFEELTKTDPASGMILVVNDSSKESGEIGAALGGFGTVIPAGDQVILEMELKVISLGSLGVKEIKFTDVPVATEVVTGSATSFVNEIVHGSVKLNSAPVAVIDSAITDEDTALISIDDLDANDTDADGDALSVVGGTFTSNNGGTITLSSDGSYTYTPSANFHGTETFDYTVTDGTLTDTGTLSITINSVNDSPVANDDDYNMNEDTVLTVSVTEGLLFNDDIGGDGGDLKAILTSSPLDGTLNLDKNGSFTYEPNNNYYGSDTFTYSITDRNGDTNTATVAITIDSVNDSPVANDDDYSMDEDAVLTVSITDGLLQNDDIGGDGGDLKSILKSSPIDGTLNLSENGSFTYEPNGNYHGSDTFTYSILDSDGEEATATVSILVNKLEDEATGTLAFSGTAQEGGTLTAVISEISDADGNLSFAYQWQSSSDNSSWSDIGGATGDTYTIADNQSMVDQYIRLTAVSTDSLDGTTSHTSTGSQVSNVDDAATGTLTFSGTAQEGGTLTAVISDISDADGSLTFAYQWQSSSDNSSWSDIGGATGDTYIIADNQSMVDQYIRLTAVSTDSLDGTTSHTSTGSQVSNVDDAATGTLAFVGDIQEGGTLTAVISDISDADGNLSFAYQWQSSSDNSSWSDIGGATGDTYTIADNQSMVGQYIRLTAVSTDSLDGTTSHTSTGSQVSNVDDAATGTLALSGTAQEGGTLTAVISDISDADGNLSFAYQWQSSSDNSSWSDIGGATGDTYTIADNQSMVDQYIRLTAVSTDSLDGTTSHTSTGSQVSNVDDAATGTLALSGTAQEGGTLTAVISDISDADGNLSFAYQWQSSSDNSSWSDIGGATAITYTIASDQSMVGQYIRLTAVSTDSLDGTTSHTSTGSQVSNVDDAATGTLAFSGTAQEGGTLTAVISEISDADGNLSFAYQWQSSSDNSSWSDIGGATGDTYTIADNQSMVDQYIRLTAVSTDSLDGTTSHTSTGSQVSNVDDAATGTLAFVGDIQEGGILIADTTTILDADGNPTFAYQWQSSSDNSSWSDIGGATAITYTIASDQSMVGQYIRLTAVSTDSLEGTTSHTSTGSQISNVDDAATGTLAFSGTAQEGGTLTAVISEISDADGNLSFAYQWQSSSDNSSWSDIGGATGDTYTIADNQSMVDQYIRLTAVSTDSLDGTTSHTSTGSQVSNVDDAATGTLALSGTAQEGGTLTAVISDISDADGNLSFAYQWQSSSDNSSWSDIGGATAITYTIASDQSMVGQYIRLTAVSTDSLDGTTSHTSTGSQVSNVDDAATGTLTFSGTAQEGGTLTAVISDISDADGSLTFAYQWQSSSDNSSWSDIGGATGDTYTIASDQSMVGQYIRLTAVSTDSLDGTTSHESTGSQVSNVDDAATGTLAFVGDIQEGGILIADTTTILDADGNPTFAYQWQSSSDNSSWSDIGGATAITYTIASDQSMVGQYIRLTAVSTDSLEGTTSHTSTGSQISNVDDAATGTLAFSGTAQEGGTLTAVISEISDADGNLSFAYQWQSSSDNSSWSDIGGATGDTYTIADNQSMVDQYIRLTAVSTDSLDGTTSHESTGSQVSNVDDAATGTLAFVGDIQEGGTLTAVISDDFGCRWQPQLRLPMAEQFG
jgi:hypothetical protein